MTEPVKLKHKYLEPKPSGPKRAGEGNNQPKRKSIWKHLAASARKKGVRK